VAPSSRPSLHLGWALDGFALTCTPISRKRCAVLFPVPADESVVRSNVWRETHVAVQSVRKISIYTRAAGSSTPTPLFEAELKAKVSE